jgi:HAD superfamily hydrolase (TIGR01509 family)
MTLPHMPAAVIFDMDGLLFDTEAIYRVAFERAALDAGLDLPASLLIQTAGRTWAQSGALLKDHFGPSISTERFFRDVVRHFNEIAAAELRVKAGVVELLDLLDQINLPRCIATSSSHATVQAHLSAHCLAHRFHGVVAHGDYEDSKPSPEPFLTAARLLKVEPGLCLALEDSHNGVRAAHAAGMMTIMVPDLLEATDEMHAKCVMISETLHDVRHLLAELAA